MKRSLKFLLLFLALCSVSSAQVKRAGAPWNRLQFLIGDWVGAEGVYGIAGAHQTISFRFVDSQKTAIVQTTHGDYPSVLGHPAQTFNSMMMIYQDQVTQKVRAVYKDSDGNALRYTAEISSDDQALTFISEADAIGHHFRTTYFKRKDGALGIKTMMAEPGRDDFYLMNEGAAYKR